MTNPQADKWREIGDTAAGVYKAEFTRKDSPLLAYADELWEAARPHSALALAHMAKENQYSTTGILIKPEHNNPMALRHPNLGMFMVFDSPVDCVKEWQRRINDPTYKDGVYTKTTTLSEYLGVYAPSGDVHPVTGLDNADIDYLGSVRDFLVRYAKQENTDMTFKAHTFPGLSKPVYIPDDIQVTIDLVPASKTNIRSNQKRKPSDVSHYTQHETANFNVGANARMHRNWLHGGAGGSYVGFNSVNDDREIIVLTPYDEVTWAAGTQVGNLISDHAELCVNEGINHTRARQIAARLVAGVMHARGVTRDKIVSWLVQHFKWTGKNCPLLMRRDGLWPWYMNLVIQYYDEIVAYLKGGSGSPAPEPVTHAEPVPLAGMSEMYELVKRVGHPITIINKRVKTTKKTPRYQTAGGSAVIGDDIPSGSEFDVMAEYTSGNTRWFITPYWTRVRAADTVEV